MLFLRDLGSDQCDIFLVNSYIDCCSFELKIFDNNADRDIVVLFSFLL